MLVRLIAARWCGLVAVLVAALLVPASPVGAVAGFGDVDSDRYFADAVQWSVDNGITGIDGSCFSPDKPVTRGETAVWIWRMQDRPQAPAHSFVDVVAAEQQQPVAWMVSEGVTTGTSDTTFSPDRELTRVEAAAFLWRLAGRPDAAAHSFVDVLSGWQQSPVSWMASRGITTGTSPTMFSPDGTLTRAQLITFLYRYNNSPTVTIDPDAPTCPPSEQEPRVSVEVSFGAGPYSATEGGSSAVELVLSAALEQPVRIPITASGSGGADSADYFVPSSVTVPSGVTSHTFTVVAYSDTVTDTGEGLVLGFGALPEGVITGGATTSSVQITDQPISDAVLDSAINIPDPNFKAALQKLFSKSATQEITVRDARSINTLNIPNLGISDLTGIEHFVNLVSINVHGNSLSGLVLPFLPKLTSLTASSNQLTSVVLESSKLPALETLVLRNNQLVEVELDGFAELRHVDLRDNVLETLVLRGLPKITHAKSGDYRGDLPEGAVSDVLLSGNPLKNFTAVNLSAFAALDLSGNTFGVLESVVLEDLPELVWISVYRNRLSELVLSDLPKLTQLQAGINQLTSFSLESSKLPALETLVLDQNQLTSVVLESSKLPALETLVLRNNQLVEVELDGFAELRHVDLRDNVLETLVLRGLPKITHAKSGDYRGDLPEGAVSDVLLSGNPLKNFTAVNLSAFAALDLSGNTFGVLESVVLEDLPELVWISVYRNRLSELVLSDLPKLTQLQAGINQLTSFSLESSKLPALETLVLDQNQLTSVVLESSKLPALETLVLRNNQLVEVELDGFAELRHVDLRDNVLETLVLRGLPKITHAKSGDYRGDLPEGAVSDVLLSGNPLKNFTAVNLSAFAALDLSGNTFGVLESVVLEDLPELVWISVYRNRLSELVLSDLPKLTQLQAGINQLTSFSLESSKLPALETLVLDQNQLTSVVLESSKLPALETLVLRNNQLVEVELDGFAELRHVDLRDNVLETLVLRGLPKITHAKSGDYRGDLPEGAVSDVLLSGNPLKNFTAVNLSAFAALDLSGNTFGVLESVVLEDLPELVWISVYRNRLSELVLSDLPKLTQLQAGINQLTSFSLESSKLPALETLVLDQNQLTSVVLESSKLPALETLVLRNNQLVEVELDGFAELRHVDLRDNVLETLVLRGLPKITHAKSGDYRGDLPEGAVSDVLLSGNPLKNFTAVNLSAFAALDLSGNTFGVLESVVLEDLPELVWISVYRNRLSELVLSDLPKLTQLQAGINQLTSFSLESSKLPALETLVLDQNQLTSVVLESSKLPALETLVLRNNQLVEVELDGFAELRHVDLRDNVLETLVLRGLPKITHAKSGDYRGDLPEGAVSDVLLSGNPLKNFTAVNLSAFAALDLSGNTFGVLESVVLEDLPELVWISVYRNRLSELVLSDLPKLTQLQAGINQLTSFSLESSKLPALETLVLDQNQLTSVVLESSKLPALETLVLRNNQLVEVELDGFAELRHVDLRDNVLETLVLRGLPKITTVVKRERYNPDPAEGPVLLEGNPGVKVFYDFPEDSSGGSGDPVRTIPVPWWARNLRVEDVGDGVDGRRSFTASWDAPEREGDSAIEGYTVTVSHPRVSPSVAAWSHSYEVTDRSFRFDHGDPGYTYKVSVRARNSSGSGPATSQEITIRCMNGDKYRISREGGVDLGFLGTHGDHSRVYALQDFKLVPNGWEIKQGYKGGVVFDAGSLSQDGCAWIYQDAAVEGNGKVSGNAVLVNQARVKDNSEVSGNAVISDDAKVSNSATVSGNARISDHAEVYDIARVYGDAQVSGDAKVYDIARVYGDAQVSGDAKVYDSAQVYGNAEVSGDAKVYGHARVFGNVVLLAGDEVSCDSRGHKSCNYNGDLEYEYAAEQLRQNFKDSLYNAFLECNSGDSAAARKSVKDILDAKDSTSITVGVLHLEGCGILKIFRDIVREFTPGPIEFILQWGFVAGSALKLGTFGASLLELLKGIDDISTLIETRKTLDEILKDAHQMLRTK